MTSAKGAALLDSEENIIDYIAWDEITPNPGSVFAGATPTDVPVIDDNTPGSSIQLGGSGSFKSRFIWQAALANTLDGVNTSQTMGPPGDNVCNGAFSCANSCEDGAVTGDETGVDCGGDTCGFTCAAGQPCVDGDDCTSASCTANVCD